METSLSTKTPSRGWEKLLPVRDAKVTTDKAAVPGRGPPKGQDSDDDGRPVELIVSRNRNANGLVAKAMGWRLNGLRVIIPDAVAPTRAKAAELRLESNRKWRLRYGPLSDEEVLCMQRGQIWSRWPEEKELWLHKELFSNALMEFRSLHPGAVGSKFFPLGLSMGKVRDMVEENKLSKLDEGDAPMRCWWPEGTPDSEKLLIVKPDSGKGGDGIEICALKDLPAMSGSTKRSHVVQKYLSNPMLIDGFKFDLRLYISIVSIDPLIILKHTAGLVRFASRPYSNDDTSVGRAHLTNAHINQVRDPETGEITQPRMETFAWFKKYMKREHGLRADELERKIDEVHTLTIQAMQPTLLRRAKELYGKRFEPYEYPSFDVIGSDIMFDSNLDPWVIEFNHRPNLGRRDMEQELKGGMFRDFHTAAGVNPKYDEAIGRMQRPEHPDGPATAAKVCIRRRVRALRRRMARTSCSFIYPTPHTRVLQRYECGEHRHPAAHFDADRMRIKVKRRMIDMSEVTCAYELEQFGMSRLKAELAARGMKTGGALRERALRLFHSKSTPNYWRRKQTGVPRRAKAKKGGTNSVNSSVSSGSRGSSPERQAGSVDTELQQRLREPRRARANSGRAA